MAALKLLVLHFLSSLFAQSHFSLQAFWNDFHQSSVRPVDGWRETCRDGEQETDGFAPLSVGFCSLWHSCGCRPSSLHRPIPRCASFSPSELIMRELYRPRQISVSLPHNTNNRGYHERRAGRIICTLSMNTRSHLVCARVSVFSSPVYFRLALRCEKSISQKLMRNSFHFSINEVSAICMLSGLMDVWSCVCNKAGS